MWHGFRGRIGTVRNLRERPAGYPARAFGVYAASFGGRSDGAEIGCEGYDELQDQFSYYALDFDGFDPKPDAVISLTRQAQEEYAAHRRSFLKELREWATLAIALYGAVTATIALVVR